MKREKTKEKQVGNAKQKKNGGMITKKKKKEKRKTKLIKKQIYKTKK